MPATLGVAGEDTTAGDVWVASGADGGSVREVLQKPLKRMVMVCG